MRSSLIDTMATEHDQICEVHGSVAGLAQLHPCVRVGHWDRRGPYSRVPDENTRRGELIAHLKAPCILRSPLSSDRSGLSSVIAHVTRLLDDLHSALCRAASVVSSSICAHGSSEFGVVIVWRCPAAS
jgi:hypothetical protein